LQVYWAIRLTVEAEELETDSKIKERVISQRDRYLKRALRLFPTA
jgi:hypothetical protein